MSFRSLVGVSSVSIVLSGTLFCFSNAVNSHCIVLSLLVDNYLLNHHPNQPLTPMTTEEYREEGFRLYEEDQEKAIDCFRKAARDKDILSAIALSDYYYVTKDDNKSAKEWLEKAFKWYASAGKPQALKKSLGIAHTRMGEILYNEGQPYNALEHLDKGADMGDAEAFAFFGLYFYDGYDSADGKPEIAEALDLWEQGMEKGSEYCAELYEKHKDEYFGEPSDPQEIEFENGDHYKGDVNAEGQPHGIGHMDYNLNGYFGEYDGQWKNGKRCGRGHYQKTNKGFGARYSYDYQGEWLDDMMHGQGTATQTEETGIHLSRISETYTGGFRQGKYHGHGVFIKDHFDGEFRDGVDRFEGDFVDGAAIGLGVWEYANGDRFEGEFAFYGKPSAFYTPIIINGHGVYTSANGQHFEGEWEDNHFLPESYQPDPSLETPTLLVSEHHEGLDWSYSGTFLMPAKVGMMRYDEAAAISNSDFRMNEGFLKILKVTSDSVTYEVKSVFTPDRKAFKDTIHRGETKEYKDSSEHTVTIEGDEIEYTHEDSLVVFCK